MRSDEEIMAELPPDVNTLSGKNRVSAFYLIKYLKLVVELLLDIRTVVLQISKFKT